MRILVVSDTHRDFSALHHAVQTQPKAEIVLHLGDGEEELMQIKPMFPEKMIVGVRGNCDFGSLLPWEEELSVEGKKIFFTHGYTYQVKMTLYNLECAARDRKADIALYHSKDRGNGRVTVYDDSMGLSLARGAGTIIQINNTKNKYVLLKK